MGHQHHYWQDSKGIFAGLVIGWLTLAWVTANSIGVYETGFDPTEGYELAELVGQLEWVGDDTGGNGIVEDFFPGYEQQGFIGFFPPDKAEDFLNLWRPINFFPLADEMPVVQFSVLMEIVNSTEANGQSDDFRWSVYNTEDHRFFTLDFDNQSKAIHYVLDDTEEFISTGFAFTNIGPYELTIDMNFKRNLWTAALDGTVMVAGQPITTQDATLSLGDVDAVWAIRTPGNPGNNYMLFDEYRITARAANSIPARLRAIERLADGRFLLRVFGEPGLHYVIESSANLSTWIPVKTNLAPNPDGIFDFLDDSSVGQSRRYYRAKETGP